MEHNDLCDSKWLDIVDKGWRERSAVSGTGGMSQDIVCSHPGLV